MGSLGSLIGFLLFPMISDNKGPRVALLLAWATGIQLLIELEKMIWIIKFDIIIADF